MLSLDEETILADILGKTKEYLLAHPEIKLNKKQKAVFQNRKKLLKKGWPLAYILGHRWFYHNKFIVNKDVLIPRPETEQLVDIAIEWIKTNKPKQIIDVGTGPGTIILSVLSKIKVKDAFAIDISAKALKVAKKNQLNILREKPINFIKGNLLQPLLKKLQHKQGVLILANLPYLSKAQLLEPTIRKEPKLALYGGKTPYLLIEKLIAQVSALNLKKSLVLLEINYDQAKILTSLIKKSQPKAGIRTIKDISGYDRFIEIIID